MAMLEILLLAVGSMFWPLLLLVVVLALQTERPVRILSWFLAGGLLTTIVVGAAIVSAIAGSSAVSGSRPPADPWVNIVVGSLAVLCALVLQFMRKPPAEPAPEPAKPESSRSPQRYLGRVVERGAPVSFVAGVVLNILPGFLPFIGMKNIAELDYSTSGKIVVIAIFYVIMFTFVEVPLVGFVFAPDWTRDATARFNTWLAANMRRLAVFALGAIGALEIVRGIVAAAG